MTKEELNELERLRSRLQAAQADRGVLQERVQNFRRKFDALEGAIEHDKTALLNQVREMCAERDVALEREKKLRDAILKALPFLLTSRWEDRHLEDLRLALLSPDAEGKP